MLSRSSEPRQLNALVCSLFIATSLIFLLCFFFAPKWETNDDVGMSMIAHGYGIATKSSPNILFSNIFWGRFIQIIPKIGSVLGYSTATMGVLVVFGFIVVHYLLRLGNGVIIGILMLLLIMARPVLFPQFTINAGLLFIGATLCWNLYHRKKDRLTLGAGCLLAFLSFLVRSTEFFLVLFVALPLLPWRALFFDRAAKIAMAMLVLAIIAAALVDNSAYQGIEWEAFNILNPARAPFTDYGAGELLKKHPEILNRYGYTRNDIDLMTNWFFVDQDIANPNILHAMLKELGPLPAQSNAFTNAWAGLHALWSPTLLISVVAALLLAIIRPNRRIAYSWGLCVVVVFGLGLLGRPGILRVYIPLISLLLLCPFLYGNFLCLRRRICMAVLFFAALGNTYNVCSEANFFQNVTEQVRQELVHFPGYPVVIWGATFPYDAVYPVLGASDSAMLFRHYGLGTSTLAPYTVAYAEQKKGHGLIEMLTEEEGISVMANSAHLQMLSLYCEQRLHGRLKTLSNQKFSSTMQYGIIEINRLRCQVGR